MFTTGETVGLAEWIIDDTCLVAFIFADLKQTSIFLQLLFHVEDLINQRSIVLFHYFSIRLYDF